MLLVHLLYEPRMNHDETKQNKNQYKTFFLNHDLFLHLVTKEFGPAGSVWVRLQIRRASECRQGPSDHSLVLIPHAAEVYSGPHSPFSLSLRASPELTTYTCQEEEEEEEEISTTYAAMHNTSMDGICNAKPCGFSVRHNH